MIKNSGFNYQQWLKNVDLIIKSWDLTIKTGMILPQHAVI